MILKRSKMISSFTIILCPCVSTVIRAVYRMKILIGVTGSVATIKLSELISGLRSRKPAVEIRVITTSHARWFLEDQDLQAEAIYSDESEWSAWKQKGDPILHIELRKWADVFLIAPLSANTLAKISNGLCDNLLTSVVRAWDPKKKMIVCPAMNTCMWENPITSRQLGIVREIYAAEIVPPKEDYVLACGDRGTGAMASVDTITHVVLSND